MKFVYYQDFRGLLQTAKFAETPFNSAGNPALLILQETILKGNETGLALKELELLYPYLGSLSE